MEKQTQTKMGSIRCASCGGLNPPSAQWCGQCLARFTRPEPLSPPPPPPPDPIEPSAPAPGADPLFNPDPLRGAQAGSDRFHRLQAVPNSKDQARAAGEVVERGAFRAAGDHITWTCAVCDEENPLEAPVCTVCSAPFAVTVRPNEPEGPIRDPNNAALISLFFPGAGHAYIGMWGQAIARGVTSLWIAATALVAAITKGPNAGSLALTFGLATFLLWLVAAHDAFRDARREPALVILKGRRFLWLTLALLAVMFVTLMVGAVGARTAASP